MVEKIESVIKKIIVITIIFQIIFMPISNAAFWDDIITSGETFISEGQGSTDSLISDSNLEKTINEIYNALLVLGVVLSVLIGAGLGIKFMVGSVEEQAKIKELLYPYVIGCIVIFGAFGIWKILINVLSNL